MGRSKLAVLDCFGFAGTVEITAPANWASLGRSISTTQASLVSLGRFELARFGFAGKLKWAARSRFGFAVALELAA